ncbi:Hypothetical_protein [Hexamita inflata]|uniref:Hypothetical_protein n=1 Tax=Hexamita inflata TaxID=28002 RepID=A0AA86R6Y4_9EUKA|nr:Hypothetical protein HINF_LOCUS55058 [Hexamita inflata]
MSFTYISDCQNKCLNGYCSYSQSNTQGKYLYNCIANPAGIYNQLGICDTSCATGYCNQTYNGNHSRYEYNCTPNDAGIYNSYSSCTDNCYYGYCDMNYSQYHKRYEYTCTKNVNNSEALYLLLFLIPLFLILIIIVICCCNKQKRDVRAAKKIQKQALKQQRDDLIVQVITEVTLPNGQIGLFIPLTQLQQDKLHTKTNQVQIYQPQPIYQPLPIQIFKWFRMLHISKLFQIHQFI